jgi:hypothetical protein
MTRDGSSYHLPAEGGTDHAIESVPAEDHNKDSHRHPPRGHFTDPRSPGRHRSAFARECYQHAGRMLKFSANADQR